MMKTPPAPRPAPQPPTGLPTIAPIAPALARLKRLAFNGLVGVWRTLPVWLRRLGLRLAMPRISAGVCALALDAHGRLLVAHHTYRRHPWGLPGGLLGRGEQPDVALARELREELGVEVTVGALVHAEMSRFGGHLTLYYTATLHDTPAADGIEIDAFRFVTPDEARKLLGPLVDPLLAALAQRRAS